MPNERRPAAANDGANEPQSNHSVPENSDQTAENDAGAALRERVRARQQQRTDAEAQPWHADPLAFIRRTRLNRQAAARRLPPLENGVVDPWTGRGANE